MNPKPATPPMLPRTADDNIAYIRHMLGELRSIANNDGADMLRYLIEMAYVEAGDILSGLRPLSIRGHRDPPIDMTFQSARKVKF